MMTALLQWGLRRSTNCLFFVQKSLENYLTGSPLGVLELSAREKLLNRTAVVLKYTMVDVDWV